MTASLVHTTESRSILQVAAEKLGTLDPGNKSAIAALTLLTPVVENKQRFCQISQNLGEIPVGDETAIASLIQIIEPTLSKEICISKLRRENYSVSLRYSAFFLVQILLII